MFMYFRCGTPSPLRVVALGLSALAIILACRASDLVTGSRQIPAAGTTVAVRSSRPRPSLTPAEASPVDAPTEAAIETPTEAATEAPTETLEPSATEPPTDTPVPVDTDTPRPTRTPGPPTRVPSPTETFTPAPPPTPTRCPDQFCVIKMDCIPGQDTRAIGHIYQNGVPLNGIRVRVSYDYGGSKVAADFISGHDPINRDKLDPLNPGYYQIGISEGAAQDGNWWVFLVDQGGNNTISEGRWFKTANVTTDNSCNIGVTDFGS